ncbi:hypothetical protein M378DRAFT_436893 [Amanita muscaria Koide BX008]|uniref:Uncharacterized protein n=1 Tax=Amanita muscaria (strain Koide BX008) TaxID=946122 RepID=A0A0C2SS33_AMAMK|nr:hypothetical protein M378DRAFT_436893 [Amanita muscaria Koide BX008]
MGIFTVAMTSSASRKIDKRRALFSSNMDSAYIRDYDRSKKRNRYSPGTKEVLPREEMQPVEPSRCLLSRRSAAFLLECFHDDRPILSVQSIGYIWTYAKSSSCMNTSTSTSLPRISESLFLSSG